MRASRRDGRHRNFPFAGTSMTTLGLNHYNLRSPRRQMEELRAFYCDVVGLAVGPRPPFGSFGYWLYAGGRPILHLSETSPGEPQPVNAVTTFSHVAFDCGDFAAVESKLIAQGIRYQVARVPQAGQVQIFLKDPAANGVELNFADDNV
jgi:catechol-2,3-dioxygenase